VDTGSLRGRKSPSCGADPPAGSEHPEQFQQDDECQRYAKKPKKDAHENLQSDVHIFTSVPAFPGRRIACWVVGDSPRPMSGTGVVPCRNACGCSRRDQGAETEAPRCRSSWPPARRPPRASTFPYMVNTAYPAESFETWEASMKELRAAERELDLARKARSRTVIVLRARVEALRTRADLLLADTVKAMHESREHSRWGQLGTDAPANAAARLPMMTN